MLSVVGVDSPAFYNAEGNIEKTAGVQGVDIPALALRINRQNLKVESASALTAADNDGSFSSFAMGTDYYIYACQPASGIEPDFVLSANSTYPDAIPSGVTPSVDNTRKIGGFHYGRVRNSSTASDVSESIVPNSVWDLVNRPKCSPEGMAKVGNLWVDIYLASDDGNGGVESKYNATPITGTEGLSWYSFAERFVKVDKRMASMSEWTALAQGSPQGNDGDNVNAWSATSNSGRTSTGSVTNAISNYNIVDCAGNVWEWLDEVSIRQDSTTWQWYDPATDFNETMESGWDQLGDMYLPNADGLSAFLAGGDWNAGVHCGARALDLNGRPWYVNSRIGSRGVCDPL
jgi:hypothetical protein